MLYGYKARTWVLISTDRSTMGTTLEEIGAPWIYISLSSGHSPARYLDNDNRRGNSKRVGRLPQETQREKIRDLRAKMET